MLRLEQRATAREEGWWDWSVWVEGPPEELNRVSRVTYLLHQSFPDPVRTVADRSTGFRLDASGWGEFRLVANLRLEDGHEERLQHDLELWSPHEVRHMDDMLANTGVYKRPVDPGDLVGRARDPLAEEALSWHERLPEVWRAMPPWMLRVGLAVWALAVVSVYLLYESWPDGTGRIQLMGGLWIIPAQREARLVLVVLFAGALGGALHSFSVLAHWIGNRYLAATWAAWFVVQPLTGAVLAVVIYLAARAVLLSPTATAGDVRTSGVALLGLLAGWFSSRLVASVRSLADAMVKVPVERKLGATEAEADARERSGRRD